MKKYRIAGIGELLWDLFPTGREMGGAPANFAYHVQSLGGEGIPVSSVGDDEPGAAILKRCRSLSLDTQYITRDKEHPTGTTSVTIDAQGKPSYNIHENVAWDFIRRTASLSRLAGRVDAVCFGGLGQRAEVSRDTIRWFVRKARKQALCIFDVTLRQSFYSREMIESSLRIAHVLKLSEEELETLAGLFSLEGDETAMIKQLSNKYNFRLVAYTRGERGSILYSRGEISEHPGYRVKVVDTVGAGDSFTAALALGMLTGKQLDAVNDAANRVASFVCSQQGATPVLPEELRRIYQ